MENNTPPQQELTLTDQEKRQLENYKGENEFLKSLSEKFCEYGKLTDRQINAFRKQETKKENLQVCPNTDLKLKQTAVFLEGEKYSHIVVNAIRQKAICVFDEGNNRFAWMPSKAVSVENQINSKYSQDGSDVDVLSLKSWFTPDKEFWKVSKPIEKEVQQEPKAEKPAEKEKIDFNKAVDEMYAESDTERAFFDDKKDSSISDELPF